MIGRAISAGLVNYARLAQCSTETPVLSALLGGSHGTREYAAPPREITEDELELFDLLKKDKMTQKETQKVKLAAKSLLHRLLEERPKVLVQDWYKDTQTQKMVRSAVEQVLDSNLPESYDRVLFREKCDNVFYLMLDYASHGRKWAA
jgi:hypothetical protein